MEDQSDSKEDRKCLALYSQQWSYIDSIGLAGFVTAFLSLLMVGHSLVIKIHSYLLMLMGPYLAYQKRLLRFLGTVRKQINALREEANFFMSENSLLQQRTQKLETAVTRMEQTEEELNRLMPDWKTQESKMASTLDRISLLQTQIAENLQKKVLENVMTAVVRSDSDGDFSLTPSEMEMLVYRLNSTAGVRLHEANFRAHMTEGDRTLQTVMRLIRKLMSDDDESNDIITICPNDLLG